MIRFVRLCIIFALDITYAPFLKADRLSCPIFYVFRAFFFNIAYFICFRLKTLRRFSTFFRRFPKDSFISLFFGSHYFSPHSSFLSAPFPAFRLGNHALLSAKKKAHLIMMCFLKFSGTFQSFKGSNLMSI